MDKLTLFRYFTPNTDKGNYYFPKTTADGLNYNKYLLQSYISDNSESYPAIELNATTFQVYEGYIDIPDNNTQYYNVTYLALTHNDYTFFYFVDSIQVVSAGIRLFTRLDLWGSYIGQAKITDMQIKRTNLNFENYPLYITDVVPTRGSADVSFIGVGETFALTDIRIIAVIRKEMQATLKDTSEEVSVYQFNPAQYGTVSQNTILALIQSVTNIYSYVAQNEKKAYITKLYIVPKIYDDLGLESQITFNTLNSFTLPGVDLTQVKGSPLDSGKYNVIRKKFTFNNGNNDIGKPLNLLGIETYLGTKFDGLKLPEFVNLYTAEIRFALSTDELKVYVANHAEEREITTSFEISAVANTGSLTSFDAMAKALGLISNITGGVFQMAAGGVGTVAGAAQIGTALTNIPNHNNGTYIPAGNGYLTFADVLLNGSGNIFFLTVKCAEAIQLLINSQANKIINKYGAYCDVFKEYDMKTYISTTPFLLANGATPVIAGSGSIQGVPQEAANEIATQFESGVKLIFYAIE